jgi:hypothetical protein
MDPPLKVEGRAFNKSNFKQDFHSLFNGQARGQRKFAALFFSLFSLLLVFSTCSREPELLESSFEVAVTVADSVDASGDYSGFKFLVFSRPTINDPVDTLLLLSTDSVGLASGIIQFEKSGSYPVQINRNGRNLASFRLMLADDDTISFSGEFPELSKTIKVDSREERALKVYERVDASFSRTNAFIQAGRLPAEEIPAEYQKYADLYWEVFEKHPGTFAAKFALEDAINLLQGIDPALMFRKLNSAFSEEYAFALSATLGKQYVAKTRGYTATVAYLDSIKKLTKEDEIRKSLDQAIIKLHLDSLQTEVAKRDLTRFERKYEDKENYSFWYKNMRFELYELTPGKPVPAFTFATVDGDTLTDQSLKGSPYILEFTEMANSMYQEQYEEATVIYQIYNMQGLNYVTIPFDENANTIIGFFEERDRFWDLANPPSFDANKLMNLFNIQYYPTRILVDADGNMYRKFIGEEFDRIIPAITETLN